ncbi:IS607 family transposase [Acidithiobacillus thiooxidans]|uniref:IS607 family transposase n=1 Tax=Acidithiobacillus thiooxidans TaxID=930 RepID=UPI00114E68C8|nr:IS607 family transposase [Acidithiobacillus thiooxidans]MDX5935578.1 IS607 family transposase [Acidithiobacillus thiooxidans]
MKLSAWAKSQGVSYRTAWEWFKNGTLPVPARQLATGTILVDVSEVSKGKTVVYARVSSHDQKPQLDGQVARCVAFANARGFSVSETITEVGSGMNGHRKKLLRLLGDQTVERIVVEHRDRLMRFGAEYLEAALAARGGTLLVVDASELKDDLVQDMISVLTSFCARLYGRRSAKHRAEKAMAVMSAGGIAPGMRAE